MKEKLVKLEKYVAAMNDRLSDPVPEKHKNRETQYRQFLKWEIASAVRTITRIKEGSL